ncbi:MAG: hypothetical protein IJR59_04075 [Firmicutes bacterium]|nr:hypothetical protein [Bacillota bacterium]
MARRKTLNLSIEEMIANKEAEIESLTEQVKSAKAELKQLKADKLAADNQKILDALAASGKSVEDVLNFINN